MQPAPLLLQLPLLRSLSLIHSLLFFRGSLTSRTYLLQLSSLHPSSSNSTPLLLLDPLKYKCLGLLLASLLGLHA